MSKSDIRWKQRLQNYSAALQQLTDAVSIMNSRALTDLEKQGLIQAFEFTHELAWNTLKDYFEDQGNMSITGSKDAAREGFQKGLIVNGETWMEMIKSRNKTSHTYNKAVASEIVEKIQANYYPAFKELEVKLKSLA